MTTIVIKEKYNEKKVTQNSRLGVASNAGTVGARTTDSKRCSKKVVWRGEVEIQNNQDVDKQTREERRHQGYRGRLSV